MMIKLTPEQLTQIASGSDILPRAIFAEMAKVNGGRVVVEAKGDEVIFSPLAHYVEALENQLRDARAEIERLTSGNGDLRRCYFGLVAKIMGIGGQAVVTVVQAHDETALDVNPLPQQVPESAAVAELRAAHAIDQRRIQELRAEFKAQREAWPAHACDKLRYWLHPYAMGTFRVDKNGDLVIERAGLAPSPADKLAEVLRCS